MSTFLRITFAGSWLILLGLALDMATRPAWMSLPAALADDCTTDDDCEDDDAEPCPFCDEA